MTVHTPIRKQEIFRIPNSSRIKAEEVVEESVPTPEESTEPTPAETETV